MTGPSSGDRPAEEMPWCNLSSCPALDLRGKHRIQSVYCVLVRPLSATPPAVRTGDDAQECKHHSWAGLMALLDEHWPDDIFPTREDDVARDAGARIVSLIRWVDRLRAAQSAEEQRPDDADTGQGDDGLRQRMTDLAAELEYYASKTYGGTWQDGANEAATRIRKVLGADL